MNTVHARIASLLLTFSITSVVSAQPLWHDTHYGMTFDEVRKLFPECRDKSFSINGHKTVGPLEDKATTGGYNFLVDFLFTTRGSKLDRVSLKCTDKLMNDQGAAIGRHFVELLQSQYGEGKVSPDANKNDPRDIEMFWITKEKAQITLSYFADTTLRNGTYKMEILYDGKRLQGALDL